MELSVIESYTPMQQDDLEVKKDEIVEFIEYDEEDDTWIFVQNKNGDTGYIPAENVEVRKKLDGEKLSESTASGKELWANTKEKLQSKAVLNSNESKSGNTHDFSESFLYDLSYDPKYTIETFLKPTLTESGLNLKNFHWDPKEKKIRGKYASFQKIFIIRKCVNIPVANKDEFDTLSKVLRVCLFDGNSILSNIHTIRAHIVNKDEKTWNFEDDFSESVSLLDFSEFFVCYDELKNSSIKENSSYLTLVILFELSIHCIRKNSGEEVDLCCGWTHLPFIEPSNKQQILNKNYELLLNGGSVLDKKAPIESKKSSSTFGLNEIIAKMFKESKIKFSVKDPGNLTETLSCLPDSIIANTLTAKYIRYFREEIGLKYLSNLHEIGSFNLIAEPIHSDFLASFPTSLTQPDILDVAHHAFITARENMKKDEKNDNTKLRQKFISVFKKTCHPILYCSDLPEMKLHNHDGMEERNKILNGILKLYKKDKHLEYLLGDERFFKPFDINEMRYEILA